MRKILQCVPMNEVLKHPDDFLGYNYDYGLVGPAALGQVAATKGKQAVLALDENNAFTFIQTPAYWWRFLGGPVVLCEDLRRELTLARRVVVLQDLTVPVDERGDARRLLGARVGGGAVRHAHRHVRVAEKREGETLLFGEVSVRFDVVVRAAEDAAVLLGEREEQ